MYISGIDIHDLVKALDAMGIVPSYTPEELNDLVLRNADITPEPLDFNSIPVIKLDGWKVSLLYLNPKPDGDYVIKGLQPIEGFVVPPDRFYCAIAEEDGVRLYLPSLETSW